MYRKHIKDSDIEGLIGQFVRIEAADLETDSGTVISRSGCDMYYTRRNGASTSACTHFSNLYITTIDDYIDESVEESLQVYLGNQVHASVLDLF